MECLAPGDVLGGVARDRREVPMRHCIARLFMFSAVALGSGCGAFRPADGPAPAGALEPYPIFNAADALLLDWLHFQIGRETSWELASVDNEVVVAATGQSSSSGLGRYVEIDTTKCPIIEWSWRVDALPEGADLTERDADDVAASLFLAFGDPGSLSNPRPVPTVRYVWSTAADPVGSVVDSPFFPGTLRNLVVRSGAGAVGTWVTERRDLREDYRLAFGEPPVEPIQAFALYTDNDQTEKPVRAYYRFAQVLCSEPPGSTYP